MFVSFEMQATVSKSDLEMPPARFELTAPGLGILCSILLSYGGIWKPRYCKTVFTIGYFFVIIFQGERSNFRLLNAHHA
jgi:hypothetical protein